MIIAFLRPNPFHHKFRKGIEEDRGGEYNGYVAFDAELPPSHQSLSNWFTEARVLDSLIEVHGGITFDNSMSTLLNEPIIPLTCIPDSEILKSYRCIGFDTLHYGDSGKEWTIEKVKEETFKLMRQVENIIKQSNQSLEVRKTVE